MKQLRPIRRHIDDAGFDPRVEFAHDVAQLVRAAFTQGYELSPDDAAELWMRHSQDICASWLTMDGSSDVDLVRAMLEQAIVVDELSPAIVPPDGYATWLDYAVVTMDTRQPYIDQLLSENSADHSRQAMRQAALAELLYLRKRAAL